MDDNIAISSNGAREFLASDRERSAIKALSVQSILSLYYARNYTRGVTLFALPQIARTPTLTQLLLSLPLSHWLPPLSHLLSRLLLQLSPPPLKIELALRHAQTE